MDRRSGDPAPMTYGFFLSKPARSPIRQHPRQQWARRRCRRGRSPLNRAMRQVRYRSIIQYRYYCQLSWSWQIFTISKTILNLLKIFYFSLASYLSRFTFIAIIEFNTNGLLVNDFVVVRHNREAQGEVVAIKKNGFAVVLRCSNCFPWRTTP